MTPALYAGAGLLFTLSAVSSYCIVNPFLSPGNGSLGINATN